jgi:hypothetical protein
MSRPSSGSFVWLYIGVSTTAVALGYMVGASSSPVVASIVPSVFGLLVVAFGVLKIKGNSSPEHTAAAAPEPGKARFASSRETRNLGIMLTIFAISYLGAAVFGVKIRTSPGTEKAVQFPWTDKNRPTKISTALEWLVVQKRLAAYGYSPDQIRQIYELSKSLPDNSQLGWDPSSDILSHVPEPGQTLKDTGQTRPSFAGDPNIAAKTGTGM